MSAVLRERGPTLALSVLMTCCGVPNLYPLGCERIVKFSKLYTDEVVVAEIQLDTQFQGPQTGHTRNIVELNSQRYMQQLLFLTLAHMTCQ